MKRKERLLLILLLPVATLWASSPVDYSCTSVMEMVIQSRLQHVRAELSPERAKAFDAAQSDLHRVLAEQNSAAKQKEKKYNEIASQAHRVVQGDSALMGRLVSEVLAAHPDLGTKYKEQVIRANPDLVAAARGGDAASNRKFSEFVMQAIQQDDEFRSHLGYKLETDSEYRGRLFEQQMRTPGFEDAAVKVFEQNMTLHATEGEMARVAHSLTNVSQREALGQLLATGRASASSLEGRDEYRATAAGDPFDRGVSPVVMMVDANHAVTNECVGLSTEATLGLGHLESALPPPKERGALLANPSSRLGATVAEDAARNGQKLLTVYAVKGALKDINLPPPPRPEAAPETKKAWTDTVVDRVTKASNEAWTIILIPGKKTP